MGLYLIETYLLSMVGYLFYRLTIRHSAAAIERKFALIGIVCLSLLLPLMADGWESRQGSPVCLHQHTFTEIVCVDYCPSEEDLPVCYDIAANQADFCQCSHVTPENILVFKPNKLYDIYIHFKSLTNLLATPLCALLCLVFCLKIVYLGYLIASSRRRKMTIGNYSFIALYPKHPLAVGSFRLWKNYIIWQKELSDLTSGEREAVLWHEIAHLRQCDTWLKICLDLLQIIWAANPIFYIISSELNKLNEHIADHFAIKKIQDIALYINVLLKMKQAKAPLVFQSFKSSGFKERIIWLINEKKQPAQHKNRSHIYLPATALLLWATVLHTMPQISKELDKVTVYQKLAKDNENSGRSLFCKHCLLEQLNTPVTITPQINLLIQEYKLFE